MEEERQKNRTNLNKQLVGMCWSYREVPKWQQTAINCLKKYFENISEGDWTILGVSFSS
jgi:hypothetical protein